MPKMFAHMEKAVPTHDDTVSGMMSATTTNAARIPTLAPATGKSMRLRGLVSVLISEA
ncbi:hypothetical protein BAU01nite_16000 [Brevibacterium aurantiacum]|nr:hypothetical protein BAU01nite_16000 [Brevibacterium aurantiacum]